MTSRRIAELADVHCPHCGTFVRGALPGWWALALCVALVIALLWPPSACAQNVRGADQVYIQTAGHALGGSTIFATELDITNLSDDTITVSITFAPANTTDDDPRYAFEQYLPGRSTLAPHEYREVRDERLAAMVPTGIGMFILEACKLGTPDCFAGVYDLVHGMRVERGPNHIWARRPISVTARVYSYVGSAANGTRGDSYAGVPWYGVWTIDGAAVGMDRPFITGIRVDDRYKTNVMIANASGYSAITLRATLYDGTSGQSRGIYDTSLRPMENSLVGAEVMFPALAESRLRREPPVRNPWIGLEQVAVVPNALAAAQKDVVLGCADGCSGFLVQGSLIDRLTGDAMPLVAQNAMADRSRQIAAAAGGAESAFKMAAVTTPRAQRIVNFLNFHYVGTQCKLDSTAAGDYTMSKLTGEVITHFGVEKLAQARTFCGAARTGDAR